MNIKQSFCAVLSVLMMTSIFCPVTAQARPVVVPTTPGDRNAVVELNTEALTFDVTVPTSLPIHVSASGEVTTADDVKIINNSHGAVTVSNVTLHSHGDWSAVDTETDLSDTPVGTKQYSMTINNETTTEAGAITFDQENWPSIYGANDSDTDELPIIYSAAVAPQTDTVNTDVAEVVFTIGWDTVDPIGQITDYYTFTDDPETNGWKVSLTSQFKSALLYDSELFGVPYGQTQYKDWYPGNPLPELPAEYEGKPVTNLNYMFATSYSYSSGGSFGTINGYGSFGNLDLRNFDVSNVVTMDQMFNSCGDASSIILDGWDTSNVTNMHNMFNSSKLTVLDLSSFNFSQVSVDSLLKNCSKLTTVYVKDSDTQEKFEAVYPSITFEVKSVD